MPGTARVIALTIAILALLLMTACGADEDDATPTPGSGGAPTASEAPGPTSTADQEQPALENTAWLLAGMNGVDLDLQTPITLEFSAGLASGNAGCNDYGGAYVASEDGIFSIPEIAQTDMACETGMELEADYLSTLAQAARYEVIEDSRLEMRDNNGETLLVFTRDTREALDSTSWTLVEVDGEPAVEGHLPTLELRAGEVSGSTGCNDYGGSYTAGDDGTLAFSELFWTERGCPEPEGVMQQEAAFLDALQQAASYELDAANERLLIEDASGQTRLIFAHAPDELGTGLLDGTGWVLDTLGGQSVSAEPPITVRFESSQYAGTAGCVSYSGPIRTAPDGEIEYMAVYRFDQRCEDGGTPSPVVAEHLTAFESAKRYRLGSERLELLDDQSDTLLTFRPALADGGGLVGTSWELRSLDGEAPIDDTTITLNFGQAGLTGESGCNSYGGPYIVAREGVISIPEITSTLVGCQEPAGVLEQESAYQTALARSVAYELSENELALLDAEGNVTLVFKPRSG